MLAVTRQFLGAACTEGDLATCSTRTCRQALGQDAIGCTSSLVGLALKDWLKQLVHCLWIRTLHGVLRSHQTFLHHVMGNAHIGKRGALAVARLQHPEFLALNGELKVLHITKALLQRLANLLELTKALGENLVLGHQRHCKRRAHTGDNILALRIDQVLAIEDILAIGRVAGECNTCGAVIAHVAIDHRLNIDSGTPLMRNLVLVAVNGGAIVVPTAKDSSNRAFELRHGIIRKHLVGPALH